ncbi:hypothetical protein [Flagellimonas sp.]|uniref:hypothetical protein n=1 Tax=Flagellimonas sp. TaxID=2058762 RepID=UPI003B50B0C8
MKNKILVGIALSFMLLVSITTKADSLKNENDGILEYFAEDDNIAYAGSGLCENSVIIVCFNWVNYRWYD